MIGKLLDWWHSVLDGDIYGSPKQTPMPPTPTTSEHEKTMAKEREQEQEAQVRRLEALLEMISGVNHRDRPD